MIICRTENEARLRAIELITDDGVKTVTIRKEKKGKWIVESEVYSFEEYNFNGEGED